MSVYRFSPIESKEDAIKAIEYIAQTAPALCEKVIGQRLTITYLTIFAHYQPEYETLISLFEPLGKKKEANNGLRFNLREPILVGEDSITNVRVRKPDPDRPQVGCVDFKVPSYQTFKDEFLTSHPSNLRLMIRPEYEMIEFFDPIFDVLAYIVSK